MKYLIRSAKYFAAFCVLYLGIVWLSVMTSKGMDVSVWDYVAATFATTRGKMLGGQMQEEHDYLLRVFAAAGFTLKEESDGRMVFKADNILSRLVMLFEDEITVEQYGQWVDITGIRRGVAKVVYRMK